VILQIYDAVPCCLLDLAHRIHENRASVNILVTGCAGFIGLYVSRQLLASGHTVVGIDNLNDYYDPRLKAARLELLTPEPNFIFQKLDIADQAAINGLFTSNKFDVVINLAAQAGVRYSLQNPHAYIDANVTGFLNILEASKAQKVKHLVYASSSSVYGNSKESPFTENQRVDNPISIYAATKKMNELMAHTYSHLFKLPTTGLRFFTVYGPWGRPDMAPILFANAIAKKEKIKVFNQGDLLRDFTYVEDVAAGVCKVAELPSPSGSLPYSIYNIGNSSPVKLMDFIQNMESEMGTSAEKEFLGMQDGDVYATYADVNALAKHTGFSPKTKLSDGIREFVKWYKQYYRV
jgi:UDP-glucuronate 4-epimerase